jgi:hypothetical protein
MPSAAPAPAGADPRSAMAGDTTYPRSTAGQVLGAQDLGTLSAKQLPITTRCRRPSRRSKIAATFCSFRLAHCPSRREPGQPLESLVPPLTPLRRRRNDFSLALVHSHSPQSSEPRSPNHNSMLTYGSGIIHALAARSYQGHST